MTRLWHLAAALCVGLAVVAGHHSSAAADEWELKAAFVYRLAGFVDWPDKALPAGQPFQIAVLGGGALAEALQQTVAGRELHERPVVVKPIGSLGELGSEQVLVVTSDSLVSSTIAGTATRPVLTISDAEGFARSGGIIELVRDGSHVRFEVNEASARRAGLRVSAKVMRLATAVHSGRGG